MRTDVRVIEIETFAVPVECRTPLKFGAVVVDRLPIGLARARVENGAGQVADGWGAMFLMHLWAWPAAKAPAEARSRVMVHVFEAYAKAAESLEEPAHPIEIFHRLEPELFRLSERASAEHTPGETMPHLGALVAASPIDHAIHDAYGKAAGIDSYLGHGPEHLGHDLSRYLGDDYRGVYPSQFLRQGYLPRIPVFHLVGGLDALTPAEVPADAPDDGIPNSLDAWIRSDGVFCLKVKLKGTDLEWDLDRTLAVSSIYHEARSERPDLPARPHITADTNEQCESPEYVVEYLRRLEERAPQVLDEVLYIEQPTERDLRANRWDMGALSKLKPVLIDESLTTVEDFRLAMELGWSGIALKSCKCLSADLMFVPMAELAGIPYAVQDLTNPSLALAESIGLAARVHTILGVEANSRQFFPKANEALARVHPGLAEIRDGYAHTQSLTGPGLGLRVEEIGTDRLTGKGS
ncbi:MAG: hypothetical protein GF320_22345 [Armatimonadia bacterium]|nr:hypothetical protein [Armatimonadia bacterium]